MTSFSYIAIDKTGKTRRGKISSTSSAEIADILASQGLELVSYEEIEENGFSLDLSLGEVCQRLFSRRVDPMEKISFAHHLAVMLKGGVPIIEAVEVLTTEKSSLEFRKVVSELTSQLGKGRPLSAILEENQFYSPAHLAIIKSGETSGKVVEALTRVGNDLQRDLKIKKKVKGAMAYPAIVSLTLVAISGFIVIFVLPKVGEVFQQMKLAIPLPTRILLTTGEILSEHYLKILSVLLAGFGLLSYFFKHSRLVEKLAGRIVCSLPVIKKLVHQMSMARFIRSLSSLLSSGVPIAQALAISKDVFIDQRYQEIIGRVAGKVKKGSSLAEAFRENEADFGGILIKMTSVGEKTGQLSGILGELAEFYEEEVEQKLENFSTIVEPVLMLLVGLGVGLMIFSIIGPIYQMMGRLSP